MPILAESATIGNAYPVDTHFPKDVVRTTDVYRRWVSWMTKHLH